MAKKSYNPGKLWPIVQITARLVQKRPELADDHTFLKATILSNIKELGDNEHCANCGASMLEYIFEFDCLDAVMLLHMGRAVRDRLDKGMGFTEANQVKVQALEGPTYAMKSRTTQMSKLGLITQLRSEDDKRVPGVWVVTKRGFDALRGRRVPKRVKVWRNRIEARTDETITLSEAFNAHRDKVNDLIRRNKQPKTDYRAQFEGYSQEEWYHVGGVHEGSLF